MPQIGRLSRIFLPLTGWIVSAVDAERARSMLRNLAWDKTDELTRAQLAMFHALSDEIRLSEDDRRRALDLDDGTWAEWQAFLADGGLPAEPAVPEMLRRLGETVFHLSVVAEARG
jgi:hypothetical protein